MWGCSGFYPCFIIVISIIIIVIIVTTITILIIITIIIVIVIIINIIIHFLVSFRKTGFFKEQVAEGYQIVPEVGSGLLRPHAKGSGGGSKGPRYRW